jgi:hypothetical protein
MNIRNTIVKHYRKFFDLHAKGIALTEDDYLDIDWAESLVKDCFIPVVSHRTFTPNCTEVEDMAVQVDQFINQHALAKPGTYSRKLREFLANKLNEYGG